MIEEFLIRQEPLSPGFTDSSTEIFVPLTIHYKTYANRQKTSILAEDAKSKRRELFKGKKAG